MRIVATLLLAIPLSTLAQADGSGPPAPATAQWSLGAGVSTGFVVSSGMSGLGLLSSGLVSSVPSANASLERRLSERTWLVLGLDGFVTSSRRDAVPGLVTYAYSRLDQRQLAADCGVRHVVTARGTPVEVSVLALAEVGYASIDATLDNGAATQAQSASTWLAGAHVGLALERELTAGISLRVATPVAVLSWQQSRQQSPGFPAASSHALEAGVLLAPRLELRLAF